MLQNCMDFNINSAHDERAIDLIDFVVSYACF